MNDSLVPFLIVAQSDSGWLGFGCFVALVLALGVFLFLKGLTQVPVGAVGVVIYLGRRTGEVRPEGWVWLPPVISELKTIYVRERQIDVPQAEYYTSDRVRIAFKTTIRVLVADPAALFDQGPATYGPFTRDSGSEEENVAFRGLVKNSIREAVGSLSTRDVMFGARQSLLRDRILQELSRTVVRWGLKVVEVWLTEVEAQDKEMRRAVQSEVRESMAGRGELAAQEAKVAKGAVFQKVAMDMVRDAREQLGRELSIEEVSQFLMSFYQTQGALEVAMRSAEGQNDLMQLFYMQYLGVPVPQPRPLPLGSGLPGPGLPGSGLPGARSGSEAPPLRAQGQPFATELMPADGSWIVGREGHIALDWDGVSRHHARLDVVGGRMSLVDLGSTNGTSVAGRQLTPNVAVPLAAGDTVRFGQHVSVSVEQLVEATQTRRIELGRATGLSNG